MVSCRIPTRIALTSILVLSVLSAVPGCSRGDLRRFHCYGTGPSWTVTIVDTIMVFRTPEGGERFRDVRRAVRRDISSFAARDAAGGDVLLTIRPGTCTDAVSGKSSSWSALMLWKQQFWKGCAEEIVADFSPADTALPALSSGGGSYEFDSVLAARRRSLPALTWNRMTWERRDTSATCAVFEDHGSIRTIEEELILADAAREERTFCYDGTLLRAVEVKKGAVAVGTRRRSVLVHLRLLWNRSGAIAFAVRTEDGTVTPLAHSDTSNVRVHGQALLALAVRRVQQESLHRGKERGW